MKHSALVLALTLCSLLDQPYDAHALLTHSAIVFGSNSGVTKPTKIRQNSLKDSCDHLIAQKFRQLPPEYTFEEVPGTEVPHATRVHKPWMNCALVGNSGMLLKQRHGRNIDRHDVVMRMNQGPTARYSSHVGSKTTHRLLNSLWSGRYAQRPRERGQSNRDRRFQRHLPLEKGMTVISSRAKDDFEKLLQTIEAEKHPIQALLMSDRVRTTIRGWLEQYRQCRSKEPPRRQFSSGRSPSTGMLALAVLSTMCHNINVFGIGGGSKPRSFPFHYYRLVGMQLSQGHAGHSFDMEQAVFHGLARERRITMCDDVRCIGKHADERGKLKQEMDLEP